MVKRIVFCLVVVMVAGYAVSAFSGAEKGAALIDLYGGRKGNVDFPHATHQSVLGDCTICHKLFPQKSGSIEEMVKSGKLESKQAMNQCRDCHRELARAGKKAGPTSCKQCHKS